MCISMVQDYLASNRHHIKNITDISFDSSENSSDACCISDVCTYSFDDIIEEFCEIRNVDTISSVDAVSLCDGWLNLIEFKNTPRMSRESTPKLKRKLNDTIRFFERCILQGHFLSQTDIQTRIIVVFNPDSRNEGFQKLNNQVNQLAKRKTADKDRFKTIEGYCNVLQLCDEFLVMYSAEFLGQIKRFIS